MTREELFQLHPNLEGLSVEVCLRYSRDNTDIPADGYQVTFRVEASLLVAAEQVASVFVTAPTESSPRFAEYPLNVSAFCSQAYCMDAVILLALITIRQHRTTRLRAFPPLVETVHDSDYADAMQFVVGQSQEGM